MCCYSWYNCFMGTWAMFLYYFLAGATLVFSAIRKCLGCGCHNHQDNDQEEEQNR